MPADYAPGPHNAPKHARVATLTSADRCDLDPNERAYVGIMVPHRVEPRSRNLTSTELLFCAHHYREHELGLLPYMSDPANVRDERWQLEEAELGRQKDGVSA